MVFNEFLVKPVFGSKITTVYQKTSVDDSASVSTHSFPSAVLAANTKSSNEEKPDTPETIVKVVKKQNMIFVIFPILIGLICISCGILFYLRKKRLEGFFVKQKIVISNSIEETQNVARELLENLQDARVICLYGDLGSGKTTFAQGIGATLGISGHITSPTFLIVKTYSLQSPYVFPSIQTFYHVDLYRTQSEQDIVETGLLDLMQDKTALMVIEWPERLGKLLPEKRVDVKIEYLEGNKRKIQIS